MTASLNCDRVVTPRQTTHLWPSVTSSGPSLNSQFPTVSENAQDYRAGLEIVPGYRLVRQLGKGFSGQVWEARASGQKPVAVKTIELAKAGGLKELKSLLVIRDARHPNLCEIHNFWIRNRDGRLLTSSELETLLRVTDLDPTASHRIVEGATSQVVQSSAVVEGSQKSSSRDVAVAKQSQATGTSNPNESAGQAQAPSDTMDLGLGVSSSESWRDTSEPNTNGPNTNGPSVTSESDTDADDNSAFDTNVIESDNKLLATSEIIRGEDGKPLSIKDATEMIVAMGLGDCTLHDRLKQVRRAAMLKPKQVGGLDAEEATRYLRTSASAIDYINQEHNIYHCDIKPQNILLVGGEAQVCDFGLANQFSGDVRSTQQIFASPAYAAPEVLTQKTYNRTVDQYCLAITYFELRTGRHPFDATTAFSIVKSKETEDFDLTALPTAEAKVLRKALSIDFEQRYQSCQELVDALVDAAGLGTPVAQPTSKIWKAFVAAALCFSVLLGFYSWRRLKTPPPVTWPNMAQPLWDSYDPNTDYETAREPLRNLLKLFATLPETQTRDSDKEFQSFLAKSSYALAEEMEDQLEVAYGNQARLTSQQDRRLGDDLAQLASAQPMLADPEAARSLVNRCTLIALQCQLLAAGPQETTALPFLDDDSLNQTRSELSQDPSTLESSLASVLIALTHRQADELAEVDFLVDPIFSDLTRAKSAVESLSRNAATAKASPSQACIDHWVQRWQSYENAPDGFLNAFASAYTDAKTPREVRSRIATGWPDIRLSIQLSRLRQALSDNDWEAFVTQWQSTKDLEAFDTSSRSLMTTFQWLAAPLLENTETQDPKKSLANLTDALLSLRSHLDSTEGSVSDNANNNNQIAVVREAFEPWLRHLIDSIAGSNLTYPTSASAFSALSEATEGLSKVIDAPIPTRLDQWSVLLAIDQGLSPTTLPNLQPFIERLANREDPLWSYVNLEQHAFSEDRDDAYSSFEIALASDPPSELNATPARRAYHEYLVGMQYWLSGDWDKATQRWTELIAKDPAAANQLGLDRADLLVDLALERIHRSLKAHLPDFVLRPLPQASDFEKTNPGFSTLVRLRKCAADWHGLHEPGDSDRDQQLGFIDDWSRLATSPNSDLPSVRSKLPKDRSERLRYLNDLAQADSDASRLQLRLVYENLLQLYGSSRTAGLVETLLASANSVLEASGSNDAIERQRDRLSVVLPMSYFLLGVLQRDPDKESGWAWPIPVDPRGSIDVRGQHHFGVCRPVPFRKEPQ